jgi:hypothetical protein
MYILENSAEAKSADAFLPNAAAVSRDIQPVFLPVKTNSTRF